MLPKLIFCVLLTAARTGGSEGAAFDQQTPSNFPKFLDLPTFDTKSDFANPTISHKSYIEHASPGTGSSPKSGGSSHTIGTRSSTLLNKAIAQQGAVSDPAILPSDYNNVQVAPPNFSNNPVGLSSNNYGNNGIFSAGLLGNSFDKAIGSAPGVISLNSRIDHTASGSVSGIPNGISSLNNNGIMSTGFISTPFDKINVPVPEIISVSVSSSSDDDTHINIPSSPVKVPTSNYANGGILSIGQLGKDVISIPNTVSINSATGHGAPASVSAQVPVPVKVPTSVGPAESSFLSSFEGIVENPSTVIAPDSISLRNIPSSPVKLTSGNYENDGILSIGQLGKDVISIPNAVSINSVNAHGAPASISEPVSVPVKISSSVGLAESSFLSSPVAKSFAVPETDSISLRKIAAAQNEVPSVNYAPEKFLEGPVMGQVATYHPNTITSQTSGDKYLSTPTSDLLGLLGNGYNSNQNGILSSGLLGAPISSIFGLKGKELSSNGLFSISNIVNNGNLGVGLTTAPVVGNKDDPFDKFETVIQHTAPANAAASTPTAFNGINNNNLFNGLIGNGGFSNPAGFPNGLFGNTYNGINGFGGGNFATDNVFSKYLWR